MSIDLLGSLRISSDGRPLNKLPKKARALLAFLVIQESHAATRERLADTLWPYQQTEQSRHSLRNCLLELRKALRAAGAFECLQSDFVNCRLINTESDLERFWRLAGSSRLCDLAEAAELYRGELLADFYLASEPFTEWVGRERAKSLEGVIEILRHLGRQQADDGDHNASIMSARRMVQLDPLDEVAHRSVMRAHLAMGQRGAALRQFSACTSVLERELQVAPDIETRQLADQIRRSGIRGSGIDYSQPPVVDDDSPPPSHSCNCGRPARSEAQHAEIARIEIELRSAAAGRGPIRRSLLLAAAKALRDAESREQNGQLLDVF